VKYNGLDIEVHDLRSAIYTTTTATSTTTTLFKCFLHCNAVGFLRIIAKKCSKQVAPLRLRFTYLLLASINSSHRFSFYGAESVVIIFCLFMVENDGNFETGQGVMNL